MGNMPPSTIRFTLHPRIRLVSFLIFAAFVAVVKPWPLLKRMRWLFLSLLILYLWFTPGQPLLPTFSRTPTLELLVLSNLRAAVSKTMACPV